MRKVREQRRRSFEVERLEERAVPNADLPVAPEAFLASSTEVNELDFIPGTVNFGFSAFLEAESGFFIDGRQVLPDGQGNFPFNRVADYEGDGDLDLFVVAGAVDDPGPYADVSSVHIYDYQSVLGGIPEELASIPVFEGYQGGFSDFTILQYDTDEELELAFVAGDPTVERHLLIAELSDDGELTPEYSDIPFPGFRGRVLLATGPELIAPDGSTLPQELFVTADAEQLDGDHYIHTQVIEQGAVVQNWVADTGANNLTGTGVYDLTGTGTPVLITYFAPTDGSTPFARAFEPDGTETTFPLLDSTPVNAALEDALGATGTIGEMVAYLRIRSIDTEDPTLFAGEVAMLQEGATNPDRYLTVFALNPLDPSAPEVLQLVQTAVG
ncbi:hypothetical protein Pan216_40350 [Planctomycetes bacterium Pan216]|uniref:Uncharacterized protein n=1 Tax=Kolteria novifilia TaxID=2527975 RepID=A0A518B859_9BACT|nr:hypothetical protein Pan216_40350 [Planctomycetes bacterium Pan216]